MSARSPSIRLKPNSVAEFTELVGKKPSKPKSLQYPRSPGETEYPYERKKGL
jgi:hypothetical protein